MSAGCSPISSPKNKITWFFKLSPIVEKWDLLVPYKTRIESELAKSKEFGMFLHDFTVASNFVDPEGSRFLEPFLRDFFHSNRQATETAAIFRTAASLGIRTQDIRKYFRVSNKELLNGRDFLAEMIYQIGYRLPATKTGYEMFVRLTNNLSINFDRGELLGVWVSSKIGRHHKINLDEVVFDQEKFPRLWKKERRSDGYSYMEDFFGLPDRLILVEFKNRLNSARFGSEEIQQIKDYLSLRGKKPDGYEAPVWKIQYFFSSREQAEINSATFRSLDKKKMIEVYYVSTTGKIKKFKL